MYENLLNENKIEEIKLLQDIMNSPKKDKSIERPASKRKLEFVEEGKALKSLEMKWRKKKDLKKKKMHVALFLKSLKLSQKRKAVL